MGKLEKFKYIMLYCFACVSKGLIHKYCAEWDKQLNYLLDTYAETSENVGFTLKLGDFKVWVGHFPYATGSLFTTGALRTEWNTRRRPSLNTMLRVIEVYKTNS